MTTERLTEADVIRFKENVSRLISEDRGFHARFYAAYFEGTKLSLHLSVASFATENMNKFLRLAKMREVRRSQRRERRSDKEQKRIQQAQWRKDQKMLNKKQRPPR